jgi:hypothetical protein
MEKYQQPNFVQPTGTVTALVASTTAATTSAGLQDGLYYITNDVNVHLNVDSDAAKEVQDIAATAAVGNIYELTVDSVVLTSAALAAATIADLVTKLQADVDYAAAPFTIAANSGSTGLTITWKIIGAIAITASMTTTDAAITAIETVAGTIGLAEIEDIAVTPELSAIYVLVADGVTLTSAALTAATLSDLVTKLQADADYAAGPYTIAASATGLTLTWKIVGVIGGLGTLTKTATAVAATVVTEGVAGVATTSNMLLPVGVRAFVVPQGAYISCIKATGASDGTVSITRCN